MRYSNETINKCIELYKNGDSAIKIGLEYGISESTIRKWLKLREVPLRSGSYYNRKICQKIRSQIIDLYTYGFNSSEISEMLDVKAASVRYILRSNKIQLRHRGPKSKLSNEAFFDVIDCERKAYYLGWLMADGCVSTYDNQYSLKIAIQEGDRQILDNFLKDIGSSHAISIRNFLKKDGSQSAHVYTSITSVHMCKRLIELGVIVNKTLHETIPHESIPKELIKHFIRGFFDGDGICSYSQRKSGEKVICVGRSGFVSNIDMLNQIKEVLPFDCPKTLKHHTTDGLGYFIGGFSFSRKLFEYMYSDCTIWIPRRLEVMKNICNHNNDGTPYEVKVSRTV